MRISTDRKILSYLPVDNYELGWNALWLIAVLMVLNKVWATLKTFDCYKTAWAWVERVKPRDFNSIGDWTTPTDTGRFFPILQHRLLTCATSLTFISVEMFLFLFSPVKIHSKMFVYGKRQHSDTEQIFWSARARFNFVSFLLRTSICFPMQFMNLYRAYLTDCWMVIRCHIYKRINWFCNYYSYRHFDSS